MERRQFVVGLRFHVRVCVQEHRGNCLVPSSYSKVERGASARAVYIWRRWCRGLYPTHSPRMYMLKQIGTSCGGAWGGGSRWVALGLEVERLHGLGFTLGFGVQGRDSNIIAS